MAIAMMAEMAAFQFANSEMILKALATIAIATISINVSECKENGKFVGGHVNETFAKGLNQNEIGETFRGRKKFRFMSPFDENEIYEIEMNESNSFAGKYFSAGNNTEWNKFLLLIIAGLKLKSTLILSFVAILALKGFLAGMTGLFVAKAIAWELYYRTERERERERNRRRREREEYEERRRYYAGYPVYGSYNYFRRYPNDYEYGERNREKPIVIYLNDKSRRGDWYHEEGSHGTYRGPTYWSKWGNEYPDYGK